MWILLGVYSESRLKGRLHSDVLYVYNRFAKTMDQREQKREV